MSTRMSAIEATVKSGTPDNQPETAGICND